MVASSPAPPPSPEEIISLLSYSKSVMKYFL